MAIGGTREARDAMAYDGYDGTLDDSDVVRRAMGFLTDDEREGASDGEAGADGFAFERDGRDAVDRSAVAGWATEGERVNASVQFRLLCPVARIGSVIGKEGRVIKALRTETGARVKVAPTTRGADERVVLVASGEELMMDDGDGSDVPVTTAERALFRIFDTVASESGGALDGTRDGTSSESGSGVPESSSTGGERSMNGGRAVPICRLLVPRAQVGSLIGKGGAVISAIRASSGATVRLMPATMLPTCASRGDELLQITAPVRDTDGNDLDLALASVKSALRMVAKNLREYPTKMATSESFRSPLESFMLGIKPGANADGDGGNGAGIAGGSSGGHMSTRMNLNGVYVPGGTEIMFRLLCPVSKTGSVIGRNGEVIQQIRSETGAKVKVCEQINNAEERIICVSSNDDGLAPMLAAQVALFRVYRCIVDSSGSDVPLPFRLLVQTSQIGCLIGKGGSIIRQIRNETGATVRVLPSDALPACANADDELLEIGQWPADACALGIRIVSGRLRGNMRHKAAERLNVESNVYSASMTPTMAVQDTPTLQQSELMMYGMTAYETEPVDTALASLSLSAPPVEIPGVTTVNSVHMTISSQHIGSVLGRGGCNISIARQVSGARIKLYPGASGRNGARRAQDSERLLEISGTSEQVSSAQTIIERFIASSGAMIPEFASLGIAGNSGAQVSGVPSAKAAARDHATMFIVS